MVFPTLFCLWIPAAGLLIGPVYYEFWHRRNDSQAKMQRGSEKARQLRGRLETLSRGKGSAEAGDIEP
jgi:hypothetical protein